MHGPSVPEGDRSYIVWMSGANALRSVLAAFFALLLVCFATAGAPQAALPLPTAAPAEQAAEAPAPPPIRLAEAEGSTASGFLWNLGWGFGWDRPLAGATPYRVPPGSWTLGPQGWKHTSGYGWRGPYERHPGDGFWPNLQFSLFSAPVIFPPLIEPGQR